MKAAFLFMRSLFLLATSLYIGYGELYSHFVGCIKGTRCDHGMICGQPSDCKSCSFEECMNHAKNRSSFGFSYRGSSGGFCRLCNETEFKMARVTSNWGLYMEETPKLKYFSTKNVMEMQGWKFSWIHGTIFVKKLAKSNIKDPAGRWRKLCKGVPFTSYCGFNEFGDGKISYTFSELGMAELKYGQSKDNGSIHVRKNDIEISSRNKTGTTNISFEACSGDVLEIEEKDSIINMHYLIVDEKQNDGKICSSRNGSDKLFLTTWICMLVLVLQLYYQREKIF